LVSSTTPSTTDSSEEGEKDEIKDKPIENDANSTTQKMKQNQQKIETNGSEPIIIPQITPSNATKNNQPELIVLNNSKNSKDNEKNDRKNKSRSTLSR